jgi:hypothetical protein
MRHNMGFTPYLRGISPIVIDRIPHFIKNEKNATIIL